MKEVTQFPRIFEILVLSAHERTKKQMQTDIKKNSITDND